MELSKYAVTDDVSEPKNLVGKVLYSSWGYDQTNIDFFLVTKATAKTITFVAIGATRDEAGYLYPNPAVTHPQDWKPAEYTNKRVRIYGGNKSFVGIKVSDYANAYPWGGSGLADTYTYGNCGH